MKLKSYQVDQKPSRECRDVGRNGGGKVVCSRVDSRREASVKEIPDHQLQKFNLTNQQFKINMRIAIIYREWRKERDRHLPEFVVIDFEIGNRDDQGSLAAITTRARWRRGRLAVIGGAMLLLCTNNRRRRRLKSEAVLRRCVCWALLIYCWA
jgi:hypothetical protein